MRESGSKGIKSLKSALITHSADIAAIDALAHFPPYRKKPCPHGLHQRIFSLPQAKTAHELPARSWSSVFRREPLFRQGGTAVPLPCGWDEWLPRKPCPPQDQLPAQHNFRTLSEYPISRQMRPHAIYPRRCRRNSDIRHIGQEFCHPAGNSAAADNPPAIHFIHPLNRIWKKQNGPGSATETARK